MEIPGLKWKWNLKRFPQQLTAARLENVYTRRFGLWNLFEWNVRLRMLLRAWLYIKNAYTEWITRRPRDRWPAAFKQAVMIFGRLRYSNLDADFRKALPMPKDDLESGVDVILEASRAQAQLVQTEGTNYKISWDRVPGEFFVKGRFSKGSVNCCYMQALLTCMFCRDNFDYTLHVEIDEPVLVRELNSYQRAFRREDLGEDMPSVATLQRLFTASIKKGQFTQQDPIDMYDFLMDSLGTPAVRMFATELDLVQIGENGRRLLWGWIDLSARLQLFKMTTSNILEFFDAPTLADISEKGRPFYQVGNDMFVLQDERFTDVFLLKGVLSFDHFKGVLQKNYVNLSRLLDESILATNKTDVLQFYTRMRPRVYEIRADVTNLHGTYNDPKDFVVHLNRLQYVRRDAVNRTFSDFFVQVPFDLSLAETFQDANLNYMLYAMLIWKGVTVRAESGHYVSYVRSRDGDLWHEFDSGAHTLSFRMSENDFANLEDNLLVRTISGSVTMLFYQRL